MPKISYTTMATPDWDGAQAIRAAREYEYDGVDLRLSDQKGELTLRSTDAEIDELRRIYKEEGIAASGLLGYNRKITDDPDCWADMERDVREHMRIATRLGAESVRIFLGRLDATGDAEGAKQRAADLLSDVLEEDDSSTCIVIQNHGMNTNALETADVIRRAGHPRLGIVFCPSHMHAQKEDRAAVFEVVRPIARQMFVSDAKRIEGDKHEDVLPGKGDVPVKDAYEALGGAAFHGWLTFKWEKIWNPEIAGPEVALPAFVKYIRSW